MAYYRDLERCSYFDRCVDPSLDLTAIGWLEAPRDYARGPVSDELVPRLFKLLESVWDPIRFRGRHICDQCRLPSEKLQNEAGQVVDMGATNLFIPKIGDAGFFVAPSLILHYVIDHNYCPPLEFQAAVLACPDSAASAYYRRIGRSVPATEEWRDGLFGYWNSMGATIADEAGLMSRAQYISYSNVFHTGRSSFSASDLAAEPPQWFATTYIAPLAALLARFERQGDPDDASAVRAWMSSVTFLGRQAPPSDSTLSDTREDVALRHLS